MLLYAGLGLTALSTMIGLPGNWILVAVALVVGLVTGFAKLTLIQFLVCVGLAVLAEVIESLLGVVIVAKRGGSKLGMIGSIVGGFAGVLLGGGLFPPVGSVILGFAGAFLGAVFGEILHNPDMKVALHVGFWSFVGRMTAMAAKLSCGCVIYWIILRSTWP
ncbi:MAG: hypothetical protein H6Q78_780 [Candidatus Krumholzibacteriota bacterium]|nr:hypothetical protein [Candidatus Krumholzibacteriota bacterium]